MNYYKIHKPEAIDLILRYNLNFIEGNIVKYILRSPFKWDRIGDLEKALYYASLLKEDNIRASFDESELDSYSDLSYLEREAVEMTINGFFFHTVINDPEGNKIEEYRENYIEKIIKLAIEERKENQPSSFMLNTENILKSFTK